jgi:hypothetical protein
VSKVDEYRKKLRAHDEAKQEKAKVFDVKALAANTRQIFSLEDADLGIIRYGLLSAKEVKELDLKKVADDEEKANIVVWAMLRKADPELSYDDFEALPFDTQALLLERMSKVFASFLQRQQPTGSAPTPKPS